MKWTPPEKWIDEAKGLESQLNEEAEKLDADGKAFLAKLRRRDAALIGNLAAELGRWVSISDFLSKDREGLQSEIQHLLGASEDARRVHNEWVERKYNSDRM